MPLSPQVLQRGLLGLFLLVANGCDDPEQGQPDAGIASGILAMPGEILPAASEAEREAFRRGEAVALRRFSHSEGLGPKFNVVFCAACHEKPVFGGAAGRYRDFFLHGVAQEGFDPSGDRSGILAAYSTDSASPRPMPADEANVFALRNPIPFFGAGLISEIPDEEILRRADPDDEDGDGISGRPNFDQGFVGRFGLKAQAQSVEAFVRGPLFNHVGITSNPLGRERRAALPMQRMRIGRFGLERFAQAAAPNEDLVDDDDVADPELSDDELFDLVSWTLLLAGPLPDEPTELSQAGELLFAEIGCTDCHTPSLAGPRGRVPLYSDLLLHDMGPELADGVEMGLASGSEFRTAPLWGIDAVGPYLHDGRADTLEEAINYHAGEAEHSRERFVALSPEEQGAVLAFLDALGHDEAYTEGLIPTAEPIADVGALGGPSRELDADEERLFLQGRSVFDRDRFLVEGVGPLFNGDSCRACHFDPVVGGGGPLGVNVMRAGIQDGDTIVPRPEGSVLFKLASPGMQRDHGTVGNIFESRQTPTALGVGALSRVTDDAIIENADPDDLNGDGVAGIAHILPDGRVGRLGWKAQVPSVAEFARDALSTEVGLTLPPQDGLSFGVQEDGDDIPDPEISLEEVEALDFYLALLSPPAPKGGNASGRALFDEIGCAVCHIPRLAGLDGNVDAYTDLLLHDVGTAAPDGGIPDGMASRAHFRTPPLWGISDTAPYLHNGSAESIEDAILAHGAEALVARDEYQALSNQERVDLLDFLQQL